MNRTSAELAAVDKLEQMFKPERVMQAEAHMLRNVTDLRGYAIRGTDGVIGRVDDAYFDDEDWAIRYLIVDAGGWLSGRKVSVDVTREAVKSAPPYDSAAHLDRQEEQSIFEHHGRPDYWTTKAVRDAVAPSAK